MLEKDRHKPSNENLLVVCACLTRSNDNSVQKGLLLEKPHGFGASLHIRKAMQVFYVDVYL